MQDSPPSYDLATESSVTSGCEQLFGLFLTSADLKLV